MTVSGAVKPLVRIPGKDHLYIGGLKICFQLLCYLQINILFQLTIIPTLPGSLPPCPASMTTTGLALSASAA